MPEEVERCLRKARADPRIRNPYAYCRPVLRNLGISRYGEENPHRIFGTLDADAQDLCHSCGSRPAPVPGASLVNCTLPAGTPVMVGTLREPWTNAIEVPVPASIEEVSEKLGSQEWVLWSKEPTDAITRIFVWDGERYQATTLGVAY